MNGTQDTAGITVELILSFGIADTLDGVAGNGLQIDIDIAAHLSHDNYLTCRNEGLTSHTSLVVVGQELV